MDKELLLCFNAGYINEEDFSSIFDTQEQCELAFKAYQHDTGAALALHDMVLPKHEWLIRAPADTDPVNPNLYFANVSGKVNRAISPARAWLLSIIEKKA